MARYHFHLRTAGGLERDETGLNCPNLEAAYLDACRAIPSLMAELAHKGHDPGRCAFEIHDRADRFLMEVPFLERVIRGPGARAGRGFRERAGRGAEPQPPAASPLSPETRALFNQLDRIILAISSEATRLRANMDLASQHLATMRVTQSNLHWSFQTWSERRKAR
jgi:hypothetical protein